MSLACTCMLSRCAECAKVKARAYYQANREWLLARNKKWNAENKDKVAACERRWRQVPGNNANKCANRRSRKMLATPPWLTEEHKSQIAAFYDMAAFLTDLTGIPHEVDHRHPLQHPEACGLHVPWNLQILTASENASKGNRWQDG